MRIFINKKIRNVSIVLTVIHGLALMYNPGGARSLDPKSSGFWIAIISAVTSTIVINVLLVFFVNNKENHKRD